MRPEPAEVFAEILAALAGAFAVGLWRCVAVGVGVVERFAVLAGVGGGCVGGGGIERFAMLGGVGFLVEPAMLVIFNEAAITMTRGASVTH